MTIPLAGVGASGALYGILFFFTVERLITMKRQPGQGMRILVQLVVLVILPMIVTVMLLKFLKYRVAHVVHSGGAFVGFLTIGLFDSQTRPVVRCISFSILAAYYVLAMVIFFRTDAPFMYWIWYLSPK